jgi:HlyD family secretion protein
MSKRTKIAGGIALLAVVLLGGLTAAKGKNKATEVRIEKVEKRDLVASVTASGQVQPHTKVDIIPDIGGKVMRLAVKEGDLVTKGQFLVEIDASQYQAAVERSNAAVMSARSQLARARPALAQAQRSYERLLALKKANPTLVSDEQVEQLRTQVEVALADVDASNHAIDQASASLNDARSALAKTTLVAPMSGKVTRLNAEIGSTAVPGTFNKESATLLTIRDM